MTKHKNIGVLGTDIIIFGEDVEERKFIFRHKKEDAKAGLFLKSSLAHPTVMIRNSILKLYSLKYTEKYNGFEDFVLWWDIIQYSDIAVLPEILLKYRQHISQVTKKHKSYYDGSYREFFNHRISVFGIECNDISQDLLYRYCTSTNNIFSENEINKLINYFKKLVLKNIELNIFNSKSFKKLLTAILWRVISTSNSDKKMKESMIHKAIRYGVFLKVAYLKILAHRIFDKHRKAKAIWKK